MPETKPALGVISRSCWSGRARVRAPLSVTTPVDAFVAFGCGATAAGTNEPKHANENARSISRMRTRSVRPRLQLLLVELCHHFKGGLRNPCLAHHKVRPNAIDFHKDFHTT